MITFSNNFNFTR